MYKVFIENKPLIFQINSNISTAFDPEKKWGKVRLFLDSDLPELTLEIGSEKDFWHFFETYKYIEAAGGLVEREGEYLFIKRKGFWDIPKGKLDKGETPEQAAVREIEEECGLIAPKLKTHLIDTWHTYEHKGHNVLKKTYWYWLVEGDEKAPLVPQAEEGITEVDYFAPANFGEILAHTFASIAEVVDALEKKMGY